jgi:hypothetical protein
MSEQIATLVASKPSKAPRGGRALMKKRRSRNRVIAGLALVAASAAVASAAMFGSVGGGVLPSRHALGNVALAPSGRLPIARIHAHSPEALAPSASSKRTARAVGTATTQSAALHAEGVAQAQAVGTALGLTRVSWWLEFAGSCSRTRGQPGADVRT